MVESKPVVHPHFLVLCSFVIYCMLIRVACAVTQPDYQNTGRAKFILNNGVAEGGATGMYLGHRTRSKSLYIMYMYIYIVVASLLLH